MRISTENFVKFKLLFFFFVFFLIQLRLPILLHMATSNETPQPAGTPERVYFSFPQSDTGKAFIKKVVDCVVDEINRKPGRSEVYVGEPEFPVMQNSQTIATLDAIQNELKKRVVVPDNITISCKSVRKGVSVEYLIEKKTQRKEASGFREIVVITVLLVVFGRLEFSLLTFGLSCYVAAFIADKSLNSISLDERIMYPFHQFADLCAFGGIAFVLFHFFDKGAIAMERIMNRSLVTFVLCVVYAMMILVVFAFKNATAK